MLAASNENLGLRVRVLEIFNAPLTDSAEHSHQIKAFTAKNYGTLGAEFVKILADLDTDSLLQTLDDWKKQLIKSIKIKSPITERLMEKYSILLTTANIACQYLGLNFNEENIISFLVQLHNEFSVEANIGERAYNCVLDWIAKNRGKLLTETCRESASPVEGTFLKGHTVALLCSTFEKILSDNHFMDARIIAHEFKCMEVLKPESKDKLTARVVINGTKALCYRLIIKEITTFEPMEYSHEVTDEELSA